MTSATNVVQAFEPDDTDEGSALHCLVIVARQHGVHLSVPQLMHENILPAREVTTAELVKCAESAGLKAKPLQLNWDGLADLGKVLPAIVRLKHGGSMVLLRQIDSESETPRIVLQ